VTLSLGVLYLAQGLGKALDVDGYVAALVRFPLVRAGAARALGLGWLTFEMVTGGALIALALARRRGLALRLAAGAALLVAAAYATLAFHAYGVHADVRNCTCFGVHLAQRLGAWVLVQEAFMLWWTARHLRRALAP
jgi:hypothetical protein